MCSEAMKCYAILKCRQCRNTLLSSKEYGLVSGHTRSILPWVVSEFECLDFTNNIYFEEPDLPGWIQTSIDQGNWEKGRLMCTRCSARLGGFDFISGRKCTCNRSLLPSVHLIRSKIDFTLEEIKTGEETDNISY